MRRDVQTLCCDGAANTDRGYAIIRDQAESGCTVSANT